MASSSSILNKPTEQTIKDAIDNATAEQLRDIIYCVWNGSNEARTLIRSALPKPTQTSANHCKRLPSEVCSNCHEHYSVEANSDTACRYHPGRQEVDYDSETWADHHDDCHGDPESQELMEDEIYRDGYEMTCCHARPYEEGCEVGKHVPEIAGGTAKSFRR